jgi:hypothetical protein
VTVYELNFVLFYVKYFDLIRHDRIANFLGVFNDNPRQFSNGKLITIFIQL